MDNFCPPVIAYSAFIMAIGLYDIYMGKFPNLARTIFYLIFGGSMLWIICAANMELVAWLLILIPVVFYVFLIAMLVFNKSFTYKVEQPENPDKCGK
jgi:hypothetical protein